MAGSSEKATFPQSTETISQKNWEPPAWYENGVQPRRIQTYEEYFAYQLRTRYMELEGDFTTVVDNPTLYNPGTIDPVTKERVVTLLHTARKILEKKEPDLLTASSTLDLIERYISGWWPDHFQRARHTIIVSLLQTIQTQDAAMLINEINKSLEEGGSSSELRALYDEAVGLKNRYVTQREISNGLQIERLKQMRNWGLILLMLSLLISPFVINLSDFSNKNPLSAAIWPSQILIGQSAIIPLINALVIASMGTLGGFLSGILQVRGSSISLTEYQENMLKLQIKPLIGSIVALVLYFLISWHSLAGVSLESPGSYILISFISGFSERYFLKLLDIQNESEDNIRNLSQSKKDSELNIKNLNGIT